MEAFVAVTATFQAVRTSSFCRRRKTNVQTISATHRRLKMPSFYPRGLRKGLLSRPIALRPADQFGKWRYPDAHHIRTYSFIADIYSLP